MSNAEECEKFIEGCRGTLVVECLELCPKELLYRLPKITGSLRMGEEGACYLSEE